MSTRTITITARRTLPILVASFDERQSCALAHAYLDAHDYAENIPGAGATDLPAFTVCASYHAGRCAGRPSAACLFEEPATSEGWALVRRWRLLPDGGICRADSYGKMAADLRAWPAAKPAADLVARAYGIITDDAGAVTTDYLITTTIEDLTMSLAWCLALVGCNESEIPEIMAVWVPWADLGDPMAELELPASSIYGALSQAALRGVRLAETEALLAEVQL